MNQLSSSPLVLSSTMFGSMRKPRIRAIKMDRYERAHLATLKADVLQLQAEIDRRTENPTGVSEVQRTLARLNWNDDVQVMKDTLLTLMELELSKINELCRCIGAGTWSSPKQSTVGDFLTLASTLEAASPSEHNSTLDPLDAFAPAQRSIGVNTDKAFVPVTEDSLDELFTQAFDKKPPARHKSVSHEEQKTLTDVQLNMLRIMEEQQKRVALCVATHNIVDTALLRELGVAPPHRPTSRELNNKAKASKKEEQQALEIQRQEELNSLKATVEFQNTVLAALSDVRRKDKQECEVEVDKLRKRVTSLETLLSAANESNRLYRVKAKAAQSQHTTELEVLRSQTATPSVGFRGRQSSIAASRRPIVATPDRMSPDMISTYVRTIDHQADVIRKLTSRGSTSLSRPTTAMSEM